MMDGRLAGVAPVGPAGPRRRHGSFSRGRGGRAEARVLARTPDPAGCHLPGRRAVAVRPAPRRKSIRMAIVSKIKVAASTAALRRVAARIKQVSDPTRLG